MNKVERGIKRPSRSQSELVAILNLARSGASLDDIKPLIRDSDIDYIRECLICHTIYFAGRLTYQGKVLDPYCSKRCGKTLRERRRKMFSAFIKEGNATISRHNEIMRETLAEYKPPSLNHTP